MHSEESTRHKLSVFISHRHGDIRIANVLRETIQDWTLGRPVKIFQSSDPGYSFRIGEPLTEELTKILANVDLFLLVYTVPDEDWSYVMFETGLATNRETANTRTILFQFGDNVRLPSDIVTVKYTKEAIRLFTRDFHLSRSFFPRLSGPFAPDVSEGIIDFRAHSFYERLQETISPEDKKSIAQLETVLRNYEKLDQRIKALEQTKNKKDAEDRGMWTTSRKVFIVHGHDDALKNELARFLQTLEFQPIILHEKPDQGQTIYGKLKEKMRDVGYAFVLLTPDDVGRLASKQDELRPRARQNVVFEHGLFVGHLGAQRVCAICRGEVETPSDLHGVLYKTIPHYGTLSAIAFDLVRELRAAGYKVDANLLVENS